VQTLLNFAGMNEPPPSENESDDDVEDELDNIGNRAPDPAREARHHEIHIDDDIGNRFVPGRDQPVHKEADEDIGNRGTYGDSHPPPQNKPQRPHGKRGFFKKHGQGGHERNGNVAPSAPQGGFAQGNGQPQGPGQGQAPGHGKKHRHRNRNKHKVHGQPGQGQPHNQGQGQASQGQPAQGQPHHAQPQGQPGQPGQGKRHRRHKNRNRNRGGSGNAGSGNNQTPPSAVPT